MMIGRLRHGKKRRRHDSSVEHNRRLAENFLRNVASLRGKGWNPYSLHPDSLFSEGGFDRVPSRVQKAVVHVPKPAPERKLLHRVGDFLKSFGAGEY